MVIKFSDYIKEDNSGIDLRYVALDWDDNILHMSTVIHMDELINGEWIPTDVSTAKFAEVRKLENWRIRNNDAAQAFSEFRDNGPRGDSAFLEDTKKSIENGDFGPSWNAFLKYLSQGDIFAIITARGHEPVTIKKGVEYIIDNVLSDDQKHSLYSHCLKFSYLFGEDADSFDRIPKGPISQTPLIQDYLGLCDFCGVSSQYCINKFGLADASNPEKGKELAIKDFVKKAHQYGQEVKANSVSMGFSDDDIRNVDHIENLFRNELALEYAMKYNVYNTSQRGLEGGIRTMADYTGENMSNFGSGNDTWGTDSSVLPFTKWNSMNQNLYNSSSDQPTDDYHKQFKNQIGQIKDLTNNKIVKKKLS